MRVFALLLVLLATAVQAEPKFSEFPAERFSGATARVRLSDQKSREYASALRASAKRRPDFAGHFVLATWGCGASCVMGAAIDAKNGVVTWIPFTVCCWSDSRSSPIEYQRDSRLLVVHGLRDEKGLETDVAYFVFDGKTFAELKSTP
ncbi:hypothetical protein [Massilia sp. TS11]|uniref:hypothetical protein n=1 Tax=Massilia sp. TS11 TaxID=2908003 RepID=UPI001EDBA736|nr:hypothetical protein [Massilia sp. TS11]MCG2583522.1 hypothetical protein [Massilia sp. TS11]